MMSTFGVEDYCNEEYDGIVGCRKNVLEKVINERNSGYKRQTSYFLAYLLKLTSSVVKNNRYM